MGLPCPSLHPRCSVSPLQVRQGPPRGVLPEVYTWP